MRRRRPPARSTSDMRSSVSASSPLVALTMTARGASERRGARASRARQPCDGIADTTSSASAQRVGERVGHRDAVGQRRRPADRRRWRGAPPCRRRARGSRAHSRTSWPTRPRWTASAVPQLPAPRTVTRPHHARTPSRRSVPVRRRSDVRAMPEDDDAPTRRPRRARPAPGCRARTRAAAARSTRAPNRARCTSSARRPATKIASAGGTASGVSTAEDAARGRHALAAAEPQPDRIDVADDRREPGGGRHRGAVAHAARRARRSRRPWPCRARRRARRRVTPDARITLAAPRLPLPTRRRSAPPQRRARSSANGNRSDEVGEDDDGHASNAATVSARSDSAEAHRADEVRSRKTSRYGSAR